MSDILCTPYFHFPFNIILARNRQSPFRLQSYWLSLLHGAMGAYAAVFIHHFDEGDPGTGGRPGPTSPPESLHEHINVSSPNTKIGLYCFLISSSTLSSRSNALFGLHLRQVCADGQKLGT
jgi:hypothetical protein